jgi:hypothetical protein
VSGDSEGRLRYDVIPRSAHYDLVPHLIGGPALRDVRRWMLAILAAPNLFSRDWTDSPTACEGGMRSAEGWRDRIITRCGRSWYITFTLSLDAMAAMQHLGVGGVGRVT